MLFEHSRFPKSACTRSRLQGSERSSEFGLACEPYESGAERFGVAGRARATEPVPTDGLANSGDVGPRDGEAGRHALEQRVRAALGPRAENARVDRAQETRDVVDVSREADRALEAEIAHECSTGWRSPSSRPASTRTADVPSSSKDVAAARQARTSVACPCARGSARARTRRRRDRPPQRARHSPGPHVLGSATPFLTTDTRSGYAQLVDEMGGRVARVRYEHRRVPRGTSRARRRGRREGRPADSRCKWSLGVPPDEPHRRRFGRPQYGSSTSGPDLRRSRAIPASVMIVLTRLRRSRTRRPFQGIPSAR